MTTEAPDSTIDQASVRLTNAVGLHARPVVKLTQLASRFAAAATRLQLVVRKLARSYSGPDSIRT